MGSRSSCPASPQARIGSIAILGAVLFSTYCDTPAVAEPFPATSPAGEVAAMKGTASATTGDRSRSLEPKSSVFVGETVATAAGSRMMMRLGQRTTLRLGEATRIKIDRYIVDAGGEIDLGQGAIQFERGGPKSKEPLTIRSEYGLIAVRGTRFFAGPSRGKFGILVGSGRVEVTSGGKTVTVGPQQGTDIALPGAPPSKPGNWSQRRIREALRSVR